MTTGEGLSVLGAFLIICMGICWVIVSQVIDRCLPVIQAYLEARCKQAGALMQVPAPADEEPGKLYPPFPDDDIRDLDDVV